MCSKSMVLGYAGVCTVRQWYLNMQVYVQYVSGTGICRCMYNKSVYLGYAGVCAVSQCIWDMQVYVQ